jgi:triphosphatase
LRLRVSGDTTLATLKSLPTPHDSILDRLELEAPLTVPYAGTKTNWIPLIIQDYLVAQGGLPKRVQPYLILQQTRTKRAGVHANATAQLEMSLDSVRVLASDTRQIHTKNSDNTTSAVGEFYEIELERVAPPQTDGSPPTSPDVDSLHNISTEPPLNDLLPLTESKLQRALQLWAGIGSPASSHYTRFTPESDTGAALRQVWRELLVEVLLREHGVRADQDTEHIHQMRVAIRRARSVIRFLLPGRKPKKVRKLIAGMRTLAQRLGNVRDYDVALANLALDSTRNKSTAATHARWQARRDREFHRLLKWLDGKQHRSLIVILHRLCTESPGQRADPDVDALGVSRAQMRHLLPATLMAQYMKVRVYEIDMPNIEAMPAETLHGLRIECKRLRYALEFSRHLLGDEIETVLGRLRKLQELLGAINDAYVESGRLAHRQRKSDRLRRKQLANTIVALRARIPKRFAALFAPKSRRRFATASSAL